MLRAWLPLAVWLVLIALESTSAASAENTGSWLRALASLLPFDVTDPVFDLVHIALRKSGHFIGYGVLGLLFFRALTISLVRRAARLAAWSVLLTAVVASLDEFHQSYLPTRTASGFDVLLDTLGAACLLTIFLYLHERHSLRAMPQAAASITSEK